MKTMSDYGLYCTEAQTKKALELGAPIIYHENACTTNSTPHFYIGERGNYQKGFILYIIPTAEEMINWLEEQESGTLCINLRKEGGENGHYNFTFWIRNAKTDKLITTFGGFHSRKEATLAAIDAALDYLVITN